MRPASSLVALLLLACGSHRFDETSDEHSTTDVTSDSIGASSTDTTSSETSDVPSETTWGECVEYIVTLAPTGCTLDLHETRLGPPCICQIPYVYVEQNGTEVPLVDDCSSEAGWNWLVVGEVLSLCGSWCVPQAFDITYGCPI